jgi:hypothetical protein
VRILYIFGQTRFVDVLEGWLRSDDGLDADVLYFDFYFFNVMALVGKQLV